MFGYIFCFLFLNKNFSKKVKYFVQKIEIYFILFKINLRNFKTWNSKKNLIPYFFLNSFSKQLYIYILT